MENPIELKRSFTYGSQWVYFKVYTGPKISDSILTEVIYPVSRRFLKNGAIDKWFFIRYGDPDYHLRIRFHCTEINKIDSITKKLFDKLDPYLKENLIWKIQLDTYHRELERYGTDTMELSETLFFIDSRIQIEFFNLIEGDEGEELRWLFGIKSIDTLLEVFGYNLKEKLNFIEPLKIVFGQEFNMSRFLKKQLDLKYREKRSIVENFMSLNMEDDSKFNELIRLIYQYKTELGQTAVLIVDLSKKNPHLSLDNLLSSYVHMLMNRVFLSNNRANEMVCYDFLFRYYKTKVALSNRGLS